MLLCEAWNASMICWVTGWDLPGLLVQKVICEAGLTFDQSTLSADDDAAAPGVVVVGPPQAARAAADSPRPARPRNFRRSRGGRLLDITGLRCAGWNRESRT